MSMRKKRRKKRPPLSGAGLAPGGLTAGGGAEGVTTGRLEGWEDEEDEDPDPPMLLLPPSTPANPIRSSSTKRMTHSPFGLPPGTRSRGAAEAGGARAGTRAGRGALPY